MRSLYCANGILFGIQGKELGIPLVEESYNEYYALRKAKITPSWDSRRIVDPLNVTDENGFVDLTPFMKKVE